MLISSSRIALSATGNFATSSHRFRGSAAPARAHNARNPGTQFRGCDAQKTKKKQSQWTWYVEERTRGKIFSRIEMRKMKANVSREIVSTLCLVHLGFEKIEQFRDTRRLFAELLAWRNLWQRNCFNDKVKFLRTRTRNTIIKLGRLFKRGRRPCVWAFDPGQEILK